jgi:hypothetical protein
MIAEAVSKVKAAADRAREDRKRQEPAVGQPASEIVHSMVTPGPEYRKAASQAAKVTGANPHYVADVKAIKKVAPDLLPKIRSGEMTVPQAMAWVRATCT